METLEKQVEENGSLPFVIKRIAKLPPEKRNKLFAIWMSAERRNGSKTLELMFTLDKEWERVYDLNRKHGFSAAKLLANEHILALVYGR